jgi:hypothetical protein
MAVFRSLHSVLIHHDGSNIDCEQARRMAMTAWTKLELTRPGFDCTDFRSGAISLFGLA